MAKKTLQGEKMEEVKFSVDKKAFKGPFNCHGKTKITKKQIQIKDNIFTYGIWQCKKCKKEFLDTNQAKHMEKIWIIEKILLDDVLTIRRSINYDGKMYFLRFPKEITKKWKKGIHADIKPIDTNKFVIEIIK